MTRTIPLVIGGALLLILVLWNTTYTVNFHELAVLTRFGKPQAVVRNAGLQFKMPFFIDQVTKLDTRLQLVDSPLETEMTRDQQQVVVQAFLFWKIDDTDEGAQRFYSAYKGSLDEASRALEQQLQSALRAVGGLAFNDLIGANSRLPDAEKAILADLSRGNLQGVKPVSVGISQVLLPPKTTTAVLTRMAEVQNTLAKLEEVRGTTMAGNIKDQARTKADIIDAFAQMQAQQIAARGDVEAARYYEEMSKHRDLATFLMWLDTLKASMNGATTIISDMNQAPNQLLNMGAPTNAKGIPLPSKTLAPAEPKTSAASDNGEH